VARREPTLFSIGQDLPMTPRRPMKLKRRLGLLIRPLRYALAVPVLEAFRLIAGILPHRAGVGVGRWIGRVVALIDAPQRRLARRQLKRAGISADPAQLRRLSAEIFLQLCMGAVEALHSINWSAVQFRAHVRFDGLPLIKAALERKNGFILVSAHMGNWELLPRVYHAYTGQSLTAVMASQGNDLVTRWLIRWRQVKGHIKLLPGGETLKIVRHLRGGGALIMAADQDSTRSRGIFVDFFGRPAYTPAGPAYLARRIGVALIPAVIVRDPARPLFHQILIADPIHPDPRIEEKADIQRLTQAYTRIFEGWIRQYPTQWVWIHDRWRHRPGQKITVRSAQPKK